MLAIENLTASYAALSAISDISFALAKGARVGIFGHNGAGKTTLLKCIVGAHTPSRGQVVYDGVPIAAGNIAATVLRGIAFVPQGHNVFPNLYFEVSTNGNGVHGYVVIEKADLGSVILNELSRRLQQHLRQILPGRRI